MHHLRAADSDQGGITGKEEAEEEALKTLLAFFIALEHPALSTDPRILCAAASSCKAWREAVQQTRACNTAVVFQPKAAIQALCSFAQWLPKHPALVNSITATAGYVPAASTLHGQLMELHLNAAQQLLQHAMQTAAAKTDAGSAVAEAAAAAAPPACSGANTQQSNQQPAAKQQQHCWRLASFIGDSPWASDMLPLLPAHSLTELTLKWNLSAAPDSPLQQLSQLTRLSSLQSLSFDSMSSVCWLPDGCLAGLAQLSSLTKLSLTGRITGGIATQLHQLLKHNLPLQCLDLVLMCLDDDMLGALRMPTLTHLTNLEEFNTINQIPEGVALPTQLRKLYLSPQSDASEVMRVVLPLQDLTHLYLSPLDMQPQHLLELAKLPKLDTLALHYRDIDEAMHVARTWSMVPQLKEIRLTSNRLFFMPPPVGGMEQCMKTIVEAAGAAKHLTTLHVLLTGYGTLKPMPACETIAQLTNLADLSLEELGMFPGDALALTVLTKLTSLELMHLHNGVGVTAATALMCQLPQLRRLTLQSCSVDLNSQEFLAALGQLTQLTMLALGGKDKLTGQGLMHLTGLKQLQHLSVDRTKEVTDEVVDRLWAALRLQC